MCTEKVENVLLPSVELSITSHVPPDTDPDDDMLLELSVEHDHSNGACDRYAENADTAGPDPGESCHTWRKKKKSRSRFR